jgi:choline kinase
MTDASSSRGPRRGIDVVVLAAGRGSRLGTMGASTPKWLLDIRGTTIAERHLAALAEAERRAPGSVASVQVVTGHAAPAIEAFAGAGTQPTVTLVHNPDYARLNNWYSLLAALRALPADPERRVAVVNADLFAGRDWLASFFVDAAATTREALIAVDLERRLTDESMKVSGRPGADGRPGTLERIGKAGIDEAHGEYVGMLMAGGAVLRELQAVLEGFVGDPARVNEWYERAVGMTAAAGLPWAIWPTPGTDWVEIDDDDDHAAAQRLG